MTVSKRHKTVKSNRGRLKKRPTVAYSINNWNDVNSMELGSGAPLWARNRVYAQGYRCKKLLGTARYWFAWSYGRLAAQSRIRYPDLLPAPMRSNYRAQPEFRQKFDFSRPTNRNPEGSDHQKPIKVRFSDFSSISKAYQLSEKLQKWKYFQT